MTTPTPRSVFVVGDGEGDCLFASGVEQYAKDHFQLCVDEANDFRTGPYTLTEYVPKRDLAARDVELKAIAHHVGGGAFYRDEHGGRLPMRDQVGQHIAELNQQLAARDAELAAMKQRAEEYWRERDAARDHADHEQRRANRAEERAVAAEQERDSAVSWNHRVSVCEKHTAEIVDGPCVICELEAAERKAEEAIAIAGLLFDAWEDGTPCYETDGESGMGASIGNAFKLSDEDFTRCADFLNRVDPRGAAIAAKGDA